MHYRVRAKYLKKKKRVTICPSVQPAPNGAPAVLAAAQLVKRLEAGSTHNCFGCPARRDQRRCAGVIGARVSSRR